MRISSPLPLAFAPFFSNTWNGAALSWSAWRRRALGGAVVGPRSAHRRLRSLGIVRALFLLFLLFCWRRVMKARRLIGEQDAVQVVNFVLEHPGHQTFGFDAHRLSFAVQAHHFDFRGPLHIAPQARHAQASYHIHVPAGCPDDDRIDDSNKSLTDVR